MLVAGLLVAALAALAVRFMMISRTKSLHLAKSLALNAGIISSSAHLVIAIDSAYRIMIFNRAAEQALMARVPDGTLMQRAATGLAVICAGLLGHVYGSRVVVLAGGGDNRGDAR